MAFGIPTLLNKASGIVSKVSLLTADAKRILSMFAPPKWGVFLNGKIVLEPNSIVSMDFKREWRISNYPQEDGAFQSYNKVQTPFETQLRMTKGGDTLMRQMFLLAIKKIAGDLNLYTILTPEGPYLNANITRYEFVRRPTEGVSLITVDIWLEEIRIAPAPALSNTLKNTATASGVSPVNVGNVQTFPVQSRGTIDVTNLE
jgi:hypothetical protein